MIGDTFPHSERMKLPFEVLVDEETGRGAAYDGGHRLMVEDASPELVEFARTRHVLSKPWDQEMDAVNPRQRARWMPNGPLTGWVLYCLREGKSTEEHLRATPLR